MTAKEFIDQKQKEHFEKFGVYADTNSKVAEWVAEYSEIQLRSFGLEVFNNETEKFERWMIKPNYFLEGISPKETLQMKGGTKKVMDCLIRIEYGFFY